MSYGPPTVGVRFQKRIDLANGDFAKRSHPRPQRGKQPAHPLFPRRDCNRREAALDTHVLRKRAYFPSKAKRPTSFRKQCTHAAEPVFSEAKKLAGCALGWWAPALQPCGADASATEMNFLRHDEQHPGDAPQRNDGRLKKSTIVALARKLLVALWK